MTVKEGALPVGVTDKLLDTAEVTQTDGTVVHREAVFQADPEDNDARARVVPMPFDASAHHAALVLDRQQVQIIELLGDIVTELRIHTLHLSLGSDEEINEGDIG